VVMYVTWMCQVTTRHCCSGSRCVNPELGDTEVRNNRLCCEVSSQVLNEFCEMLNLSLIVL
jgi:hypothetical protein